MTASGSPERPDGTTVPPYVGVADVLDEAAPLLLHALARARIDAFARPAPDGDDDPTGAAPVARIRLFVSGDERLDARSVVRAAARDLPPATVRGLGDALSGATVEDRFAELVGDWHVDTLAAVREAERELRQQDVDWRTRIVRPPSATPRPDLPAAQDASATGPADGAEDAEEHYVPPAPPPLPRLSPAVITAVVVLVAGIAVLVAGRWLGLGSDLGFLVGVAGVLISAGILVMRLRTTPRDEDDDGAML